jgi:subtilisin-like proprotein convertase family protein
MFKFVLLSLILMCCVLIGCDGGNGGGGGSFVPPDPQQPPTPAITSSPSTSATVGVSYTYQITTAATTAPLTFSLLTFPTGMTFSATGQVSWLPSSSDVGPNAVSLQVNDAAGNVLTQNFTITVSPATQTLSLSLTPTPPVVLTGGGVPLNIFAVGSPTGGIYTLSSISTGSTGGAFSSINPASGTFSFSGYSFAGTASVLVTYSLGSSTPVSLTYVITVNAAPLTPTLACSSACLSIPDLGGGSLSASIAVTNGPVSIADLNVFLDLSHTFTSDLDIFLTSPSSTTVELTTDNGGGLDNLYSGVIFDGASPSSITTITSIGGVFAPEGNLSAFNGENANGIWTLLIADDRLGDTGRLNSFCLAFDGVAITNPNANCNALLFCTSPRTFISESFALGSRITVAGGPIALSDVTVMVDITHPFPAELDITLRSAEGTVIELTSDNGSGGLPDLYSTTTFDDSAGTSILAITLPGGTFRPEQPLSTFNGEDCNGDWTLTVTDDTVNGNIGCIGSWCLAFEGTPLINPDTRCGGTPVPLLVCDSPLSDIPDSGGGTLEVSLTVSSGPFSIQDLNVLLDVRHAFTSDLDIFLQSPANTIINLTSDNGGSGTDLYSTVTFDDQSPLSINSITAPGGTFRPEQALSTFIGENANGIWRLSLTDDGAGDTGCIGSWCLAFDNASVVDPMVRCIVPVPSLFCQNPGVTIPDNGGISPLNSSLTVSSGPPILSDLNVFLDISHPVTGNLSVFLTSPAGTRVELTSGNGGVLSDLYSTVTLDDSASSSVTGIGFAGGIFRPEGSLSAFNGQSANGVWTLEVFDTITGNEGCLGSWCLAFDGQPILDPMARCTPGGGIRTSLSFSIPSPAIISVGSPSITIQALGFPAGGTFSNGVPNSGITGGTFSSVDPSTGFFTFSGATATGTANVNITYTPSGVGASVTLNYVVDVKLVAPPTSIQFSPASPASVVVGDPSLTITALGIPSGGVYSSATLTDSGTGGTFSAISPSTGVFTFSGALASGTASIPITYTPPASSSLTLTYSVFVTNTPPPASLNFVPASPITFVVGSPSISITAIGSPTGGMYSNGVINTGSTAGSFSAINPTNGTFTFSGAITSGVAVATVIYTPLSGSSVSVPYTVNVLSVPPLASLSFNPATPATLVAGSATLQITANGNPAGGSYSSSPSFGGSTGGTFSAVSPTSGTFSFSGSNASGTAFIDITYTPPIGSSITARYTLQVLEVPPATSLSFNPNTPASVITGDSSLTITAQGFPSGGFYSRSNLITGGTGGTFSSISLTTGVFTFSNFTNAGTASVDITYTPQSGIALTLRYSVLVSTVVVPASISFNPLSPAQFVIGNPELAITATGTPSGGIFSLGNILPGTTNGSFSGISPSTGAFFFSKATALGSASADVTYTPQSGTALTLRYTVQVFSVTPPSVITFIPANPTTLSLGSPALTITANGIPSGGLFSSGTSSSGGTGGSFSTITPTQGIFIFSGATALGTASIAITYTPLNALPLTVTYSVQVQDPPVVPSLSFLPPSPASYVVNNPALTLNAIGSPSGGTYSLGATSGGGTGGSFSAMNPTTGIFTFSGANAPGNASVLVQYTTPSLGAITLTYTVTVFDVAPPATLSFSPTSPTTLSLGDPTLVITAIGSPSGGVFTQGASSSGTTSGTFSSISASTGVFTFSAATGVGSAVTSITYTAPVTGSAVTLDYVIQVLSNQTPLLACATPNLALADNASTSNVISVIGGPQAIADLKLFLDISHSFTGDLALFLSSPLGTRIRLSFANGGSLPNLYSGILLDDLAGVSITLINSAGGVFAPEDPLSTFLGEDSNGNWTLEIQDLSGGNTGVLRAWCLAFDGATIIPPTNTSLSFVPASPAIIGASAPLLSITAVALPAGGTYSSTLLSTGGTGGSFSAIGSSSGVFSFSGSTSAGTASLRVTYTPLIGSPLSLTYQVVVNATPPTASLSFTPGSPSFLVLGSPASSLSVTALGFPSGGTYSASAGNVGGTNGSFSAINTSTGLFTFSGASGVGTATRDVTYTPPSGSPVSASYSINVVATPPATSLSFNPLSPLNLTAGSSTLTITATGTPAGGTYSSGLSLGGGTGGTFSAIHPSTGVFAFFGSTAGGNATIEITYTPPSGSPLTLVYTASVSLAPAPTSLGFNPSSPVSLTAGSSVLTVQALGSPAGGLYSSTNALSGGTGGSFSTITPTTGVFTFSGATLAGTASLAITYTVNSSPVTLTYVVVVTATPLPASLSFTPASPITIVAGDPSLTILTSGSPAGGVFSTTNPLNGSTGGSFSPIDPATGTFSFFGSTAGGSASMDVTYTPSSGLPTTVTYIINVLTVPPPTASLSFSPLSPAGVVSGAVALTINALGSPSGGTYSSSNVNLGGTGGTFSPISSSLGSFSYSGSISAGTASIDITYTPLSGSPVTLTYVVNVTATPPATTLIFTPPSPASFFVGDPLFSITATGSPSGGTFSNGPTLDTGTGGTFSTISAFTGIFTFSGASNSGTVSVDITYTPLSGSPLTLTYIVNVLSVPPPASISFIPAVPASVTAFAPPLNITAIATPVGGSFSSGASVTGGTGGTFSAISPSSGTFSFSGSTASGTASVLITYTPLSGSPVSASYVVSVTDPVATPSLSFIPASPATLVVGSPSFNITAVGSPSGGIFSSSLINTGGTGGSFSSINSLSGLFSFSGTSASGTASVLITYTPAVGTPVSASYVVSVVSVPPPASLAFAPTSPSSFTVGDPTLNIFAAGSPVGGIYSSGTSQGGTTGGSFSAISPSLGTFTYTGATSAGSASVLITYTPLAGAPVSATYTVNVSSNLTPLLACSTPNLTIPTLGTVIDTLTVSGGPNSISDLDVFLDLEHTFPGDLNIFLISPNATSVELTTRSGGGVDNLFVGVVFDDSASVSITSITSPGIFAPEGFLSTLNGESANGVWTLSIQDAAAGDGGTLNSWCLAFDTASIIPPAVTSLTFNPLPPATVAVGAPALTITAIGAPLGGTYSDSNESIGSTGGNFSSIHPSTGVFTFSGSVGAGSATLDITYLAPSGNPLTLTYSVFVTNTPPPASLTFLPTSPASLSAGSPALSITATGTPSGGTYSTSSALAGGTGGSFSSINSTTGIFTFSGTSASGTASVNVTYTPPTGSPVTQAYVINVSAVPPPASLSFNPFSPASATAGDPPLTIIATGSPVGGTYSSGVSFGGGTGGVFSPVAPSTGAFTFDGALFPGNASVDITYTPSTGAPVTVTYSITVFAVPPPASLSFNPVSPASLVSGSPALNITAFGSPAGGVYSSGSASGGGTGGTFSAISPTLGTFTFSGSTNAGTASLSVTYTPLSGTPAVQTYVINVSVVPPPASLVFNPSSPASLTAGDPALTVLALGSPSGGVYSSSSPMTGTTGGTFSAVDSATGVFSFSGTNSAGNASLSLTYTPFSGTPVTQIYSITVSAVPPPTSLIFSPFSPASVTTGSPALNITATGTPSGGTYSTSAIASGGTGGTFSSIHPTLGTFTYSGSTSAGAASIDITYTPLSGLPLTLSYVINVSIVPPPTSLVFSPPTPATYIVGSPALTITAVGSPSGGTYSSTSALPGTTGGVFSAISPTTGVFSFSGAVSAGSASINVTYTPLTGSPVTLSYVINVSITPPPTSLTFNPSNPVTVTAGDPDLTIFAVGSPSGGTYSNGTPLDFGTGGSFSAVSPSTGIFTYGGSVSGGSASVLITYTPPLGAPLSVSYQVNVSATPPPASLTFIPNTPASFVLGSPALNITAVGSPAGGSYSTSNINLGGTGGLFSSISPSLGTLTFSGSVLAGIASVDVTYMPLAGAPLTLNYVIIVSSTPPPTSLSFNPLSPSALSAGAPSFTITATGLPTGGTYSSGPSLGGSTGGSFSAIHPTSGVFSYAGSTSAGTASIDITYTPLSGSPVTLTYSVDVSAVPPPTSLSFNPLSPAALVSGSPALNITANGSPAGGSYATSNALSGGTGGSFSSIHPSLGTFTFSGSSSAGSASVDVTYTPLSGSPLTLSYVVNVSVVPPPTSLSFNPLSPATILAGSPDLNITATGSPVGGTYSSGSIVLGGTGGSFSAIHPSLGTFTFAGSSSAGTASSNITYTPVSGSPLTLTYSITVTFVPPPASLSFNPLSPASLTSGDPDLNITANGSPVGGSYTSSNASSGSTGGTFSSIHPSLGTFTYSGSTSAGTASVDITYTPVVGAPVLQSYVVNVSATPPPATLSFNPSSPTTFTTGSPALTVTATGSPSGGTYSSGSIVLGGTGGSFSAVHPSLGTFTFGSASSAGTASIGITYTPLSGAPVVATYVVTVLVTPPPASLSFNPLSPASVTAGDPDLNITALGSPSGGTFSSGASLGGSTGGTFTAVHPSLGTFTYMGSTSAGTASIDITYTPLVGAPVVVTYSVDVSAVTPPTSLSFNPLSPSAVVSGSPALNITASGSPAGGTYSTANALSGGTGGTFSSIHPSLGTFTFSGSSSAGSASVDVTYTPLSGSPLTLSYVVNVSVVPPPTSLSFNPLSPATTLAGSPDLNITATGSPAGGTYSSGSVVLGGTGGSFSAIHPSLGTFTFGGSSSAGTASSNITYTPLSGSPLTLTYSITVTFVPPPASLSFNPLSPASLTSGDPDLNITANGSPVGGSYTSSNPSSGSTGGSFSSIHPSLGSFTYGGSTASGTASVDITYTPVVGAPVLQSYVVNVSATPPPATLSFNPLSPATFTTGSPALTVTAIGSPVGGTYSSGSIILGGTGGSFSAVHPSLGTFTFGSASSAGTASIGITYTPLSGAPVVATYVVTVVVTPPPASLSFNPLSPASVTAGDPDLNITALGSPSGGTFTSGASLGGSTGGSFTAVHPSLGTFTYMGSTSAGTASIDITYTPLVGAPVVVTYSVDVSAVTPPTSLSFNPLSPSAVVSGSPALNITASGSPAGGTYSTANALSGGTGGTFSSVHPSLGTFTFSGSSSAGSASVDVTYTPLSGSPLTLSYVVNVSVVPPPTSLSFNPLSPATTLVGSPDLNITATGSPVGGTYSSGSIVLGGTGGSFSAIHPSLGTFTFAGSSSAGTASSNITYTPVSGSPLTLTYSITVTFVPPPASLSFNPLSPASLTSGDPDLNITANGSPVGGSYTSSNASSGSTGGSFSSIHPSLGTFTYGGSTASGTASVDITYTPVVGAPVLQSYVVNVSATPPPATLSFNPLSPATFTTGSPALTVTATGSPSGGTYSSGSIVLGGTGGSFSAVHPSLGTFTFGSASSAGTASIGITYTPLSGAPVVATYVVTVVVTPPPASLSFNPLSPASVTAGDPDLNITALGSPSGGIFSSGASLGGSTGGSFTAVHPSLGTFTYMGSTSAGTASIDITYTPLVGSPVTLTYSVDVSAVTPPTSLTFNPLSPSAVVSGSPALNITANGSPAGGSYTTSNALSGGTGGIFSSIHPSLGTFTFSGSSSAGSASVDVTYTPLSGSPLTLSYVVNVSVVPPSNELEL